MGVEGPANGGMVLVVWVDLAVTNRELNACGRSIIVFANLLSSKLCL